MSEGCNLLIRQNGATLITSAADLLTDLGWETSKKAPKGEQATLFTTLTAEEQAIVDALVKAGDDLSLADLSSLTGKAVHQLMPLILTMEMKGIVKVLPGNRYHLIA